LPLLSARPLEDIAEEGRERTARTFTRDCQCLSLSEFHYTMLGVDGAKGWAGDRRLFAKRKSKSFDAPPAVGNADSLPSLQLLANSLKKVQKSLHQLHRHRRLPASLEAMARRAPPYFWQP
jgi:hypothetical protein